MRSKNIKGGAMIFALAATAVVGILIASFLSQSQGWLERSQQKSRSEQITRKAHANYERMLPIILQAYSWAMEVRAGAGDDALPSAPRLLEAYAGDLSALAATLRACQRPCVPSPDFLSKVFPSERASTEGWRFQIVPLANSSFESELTSFPKRISLTVYQSDPERPGLEVRVTGQFVLAPTSLSAFSALAWGLPPDGMIIGPGTHDNIGVFFNLTDNSGNPIDLPDEDCADRGEHVPGQAPNLKTGSIYLMPPAGTSLEIKNLATNVNIERVCYGLNRANQYAYWWSNANDLGSVKLGGTVVMGSVGESVETNFRSKFNETLTAIRTDNPFVPPAEEGAPPVDPSKISVPNQEGSTEDYIPYEQISGIEYYESLLKEGKITEDEYVKAKEAYLVSEGGDAKTLTTETPVEPKEEVKEETKEGAAEVQAVTNCPADWVLDRAELILGACSNGRSCSIGFKEYYKSACRGSSVAHSVYSGTVASMPASYKQTLATSATRVDVLKDPGLSGDVLPVGEYNLTLISKGPAKLHYSVKQIPEAENLPLSDPNRLGHLAFINVGEGPAAIIDPDFKTLTGTTLSQIKSGAAAQPSASTVTARLDAGFFAVGSPTNKLDAKPISMDSSLLTVEASGNKTFGEINLNGPSWAPLFSSLRMSSSDLSQVVTGFAKTQTTFAKSWERSAITNVQSSKYLSYSEVSRSVEVYEGDFSGRAQAARQEVGIE